MTVIELLIIFVNNFLYRLSAFVGPGAAMAAKMTNDILHRQTCSKEEVGILYLAWLQPCL